MESDELSTQTSLERRSYLSCFSVSVKKQQVLVWYFQDLFGDLYSSVGSGRQETVGQPADQQKSNLIKTNETK